ncbi:MAG: hypothetical protein E4H41_04585 [Gemmatimonadales bacterium]|jgi:hypothetical protein|nr:MAG: hypothetical protein E4H41_04585 [Gemmatimonadales bacterium]
MHRLGLLALALCAAPPLAAQSGIEITPSIGYRFGGTIDNDDGKFSANDNLAWGGTLGYRVKRDGLVELVYSRQSTTVRFKPDTGAAVTIGDAAIEYLQLGGALEFGDDPNTKPFFALTIGGTHFAPENPDLVGEWVFSFGAALGLKTYLSQHVGLRAQARLWMSTLSSNTQFWCSLPGGCVIHASSGVFFTQGELSGGVMFVF